MTAEAAWERAREVVENQQTCTLATSGSGGTPEAATVRFVADKELNLSTTTQIPAKKYENLTANSADAVVIDGGDNLQLKGTAREVSGEAADRIRLAYVEKYGQSPYLTNDQSVFFEITTHWARLLVDDQYPSTYATLFGERRLNSHDEDR
jgi:nitroimidazol reductase NimA-like FMN-containing flavoprotein (pyridoxamine 5'-phosphate oxidase superfamily)